MGYSFSRRVSVSSWRPSLSTSSSSASSSTTSLFLLHNYCIASPLSGQIRDDSLQAIYRQSHHLFFPQNSPWGGYGCLLITATASSASQGQLLSDHGTCSACPRTPAHPPRHSPSSPSPSHFNTRRKARAQRDDISFQLGVLLIKSDDREGLFAARGSIPSLFSTPLWYILSDRTGGPVLKPKDCHLSFFPPERRPSILFKTQASQLCPYTKSNTHTCIHACTHQQWISTWI